MYQQSYLFSFFFLKICGERGHSWATTNHSSPQAGGCRLPEEWDMGTNWGADEDMFDKGEMTSGSFADQVTTLAYWQRI